MTTPRTLAAVAAAAFVAAAAAGCTSVGATNDDGGPTASVGNAAGSDLIDFAAANKEYTDTLASLTLPEGYRAPKTIPAPKDKTMYERGFGVGVAERRWICAWEEEWLEVQGTSEAAATAAMTHLEEAKGTTFMSRQLDDAGRRMYDDYVKKAGLGDPSGIQQDVDQNCGA